MARRVCSLICAVLCVGALLLGCRSTPPPPPRFSTIVPGDGDIVNWRIDLKNHKTANERPCAALEVDRVGMDPYGGSPDAYWVQHPPRATCWQNYVNAILPSSRDRPDEGSLLSLYVSEMPSRNEAAGLYAAFGTEMETVYAVSWEEPTSPLVGEKSRIANTGEDWWINFYKSVWYCELRLTPSCGKDLGESDQAQKEALLKFAKAVASNM